MLGAVQVYAAADHALIDDTKRFFRLLDGSPAGGSLALSGVYGTVA
uniref:Uncharacterized protein n=1 Tax=mine drainage metagenome TaxID=410659 RepID=E6QJC2_9ZZZZ